MAEVALNRAVSATISNAGRASIVEGSAHSSIETHQSFPSQVATVTTVRANAALSAPQTNTHSVAQQHSETFSSPSSANATRAQLQSSEPALFNPVNRSASAVFSLQTGAASIAGLRGSQIASPSPSSVIPALTTISPVTKPVIMSSIGLSQTTSNGLNDGVSQGAIGSTFAPRGGQNAEKPIIPLFENSGPTLAEEAQDTGQEKGSFPEVNQAFNPIPQENASREDSQQGVANIYAKDSAEEEQRKIQQRTNDDKREQQQQLAEQQVIKALSRRDAEVKAHEQAHAAVGGQFAQSPNLKFEQGPDGRRYAVDGEVQIDVGAVSGDPLATVNKMKQVYAAAMAPVNPSMADVQVAAEALKKMNEAKAMLAEQRQKDAIDIEEMAPLLGAQAAIDGIPPLSEPEFSVSGEVDETGNIVRPQDAVNNPVADTISQIDQSIKVTDSRDEAKAILPEPLNDDSQDATVFEPSRQVLESGKSDSRDGAHWLTARYSHVPASASQLSFTV